MSAQDNLTLLRKKLTWNIAVSWQGNDSISYQNKLSICSKNTHCRRGEGGKKGWKMPWTKKFEFTIARCTPWMLEALFHVLPFSFDYLARLPGPRDRRMVSQWSPGINLTKVSFHFIHIPLFIFLKFLTCVFSQWLQGILFGLSAPGEKDEP